MDYILKIDNRILRLLEEVFKNVFMNSGEKHIFKYQSIVLEMSDMGNWLQ